MVVADGEKDRPVIALSGLRHADVFEIVVLGPFNIRRLQGHVSELKHLRIELLFHALPPAQRNRLRTTASMGDHPMRSDRQLIKKYLAQKNLLFNIKNDDLQIMHYFDIHGLPEPRVGALKTSKTSETYKSLKSDLLNGHFAPGVQMRIDAISKSLDVSVGAVREALSRLTSDGIVENV